MNEDLVKLIKRVREAVDRGDMFVGHASEFPGLDHYMRLIDIPVGVYDNRVLLKMRRPRKAKVRTGEILNVVAYYDGVYYSLAGGKYREKDLCWVEEKELP